MTTDEVINYWEGFNIKREHCPEGSRSFDFYCAVEEAIKALKKLHDVPQGEWIPIECPNTFNSRNHFACPFCSGEIESVELEPNYKYCPCCGLPVSGVKEDGN